jgi:polyhydroxybutyrate depolymerase
MTPSPIARRAAAVLALFLLLPALNLPSSRAAAATLPGGIEVPEPSLPGLSLPALPGLDLPLPPPGLRLPSLDNLSPLADGLRGGLLQASGGITPTPGTETFSGAMVWAGTTRTYVGIRPTGAPAGAPVLLLLHPLNLAPGRMANLTAAGRLAAQYGVWVYLPAAVNGSWSDNPMFPGTDDVGFLDALLAREVAAHALDAARVYAAGYSKGGYMAERLACERPNRLAGMALVAATLRDSTADVCAGPQRLPVLMFNGTADPITAYEDTLGVRGAVATAAFWADKNRCVADAKTVTAVPDLQPLDGATVTVTRFDRCDASTVALYTVNNGGHTWPGTESSEYTIALGATTLDIDATLELWQRLAPYARPAVP